MAMDSYSAFHCLLSLTSMVCSVEVFIFVAMLRRVRVKGQEYRIKNDRDLNPLGVCERLFTALLHVRHQDNNGSLCSS